MPYQRDLAVDYAHRWAYRRNPRYYDYEALGGDCTNFASQCLYAGAGVMNYTPQLGWYYTNANQKAPAWTGVEFFFRFLTGKKVRVGPVAEEVSLDALQPGDFVQLSFDGISWAHTPVVVAADHPTSLSQVLVAAHSYDTDHRPLHTYEIQKIRFLHITGVYQP